MHLSWGVSWPQHGNDIFNLKDLFHQSFICLIDVGAPRQPDLSRLLESDALQFKKPGYKEDKTTCNQSLFAILLSFMLLLSLKYLKMEV